MIEFHVENTMQENVKATTIIERPVPISIATGKITLLFEPYERERVLYMLQNGSHLCATITLISSEVSDPIRRFFYGHVFSWVTSVYEKYTQETITVNRVEFGKNLLKAIYEQESNKFEFLDITFKVSEKPISFSRSDSTKRIMQAMDIWTLWFANNLQEQFPIPDKDWYKKQ